MTGLDDAGMDRTHRDLVEACALRWEKPISRVFVRRSGDGCQRMPHIPPAMVEPGPRVRQVRRLDSEQVTQRTLETDRRRMNAADRGKMPVAALPCGDDDLPLRFLINRHMDGRYLAPETEQSYLAVGEPRGQCLPEIVIDDEPRMGPVQFDDLAGSGEACECGHASSPSYPSRPATCWNQATRGSGRYTPAVITSARWATIGA